MSAEKENKPTMKDNKLTSVETSTSANTIPHPTMITLGATDTLQTVAKRYYGDEKYARFIHEHNPHIINPDCLNTNTTIILPPRMSSDTLDKEK